METIRHAVGPMYIAVCIVQTRCHSPNSQMEALGKGGVQDQMYMDACMINNIYSYIYKNVYIYIYTSDRCK